MTCEPFAERMRFGRWVATVPTLESSYPGEGNTIIVPISGYCATGRTKRSALRKAIAFAANDREHDITVTVEPST